MPYKVEVQAGFGDREASFANYPDEVSFDMSVAQYDGPVTLDRIIVEARTRASNEFPTGDYASVELKTITIEMTKI